MFVTSHVRLAQYSLSKLGDVVNYFDWHLSYPPLISHTTKVYPTAQKMIPAFAFFRHTFLHVSQLTDLSWNAFPGIYSTSPHKLKSYAKLIQKYSLDETTAYARGSLDARVMVLGIAPGWTDQKFSEAMWLLGPSSVFVRKAMTDLVYFSNLSWNAFPNNKYDKTKAQQAIQRLQEEIQLINPSTVIILGKYQEYNDICLPSHIKKVQVTHPSYTLRQPKEYREKWISRLQQLFTEPLKEDLTKLPKTYKQHDTLYTASTAIFSDTDTLEIRKSI